jgi:hypothetical protein
VPILRRTGLRFQRASFTGTGTKGAIRINPDGTVLETEVRAYAATLERINGDVDDLSDAHAVKTQKEIERLNEQIAKMRFEREKEEGKYIPKKEFEAELAARAAVLEAGFRHTFNVKVREWIALVGGKAGKSADFLQELNTVLDEQLNSFATTRTFQVMFEEEDQSMELFKENTTLKVKHPAWCLNDLWESLTEQIRERGGKFFKHSFAFSRAERPKPIKVSEWV